MRFRPGMVLALKCVVAGASIALGLSACSKGGNPDAIEIALKPSLEDVMPDGAPFAPGTQSLLRHEHWLESVATMSLSVDGATRARAQFNTEDESDYVEFVGMPLDYLVPRLHYRPAEPPDAFDAFNLMLAEYSRNGLSVPTGESGDTMAHFETSLHEAYPWKLTGDYEFRANARFRPVRMGMVNNCLRPGLWEVSGSDRSGEIYHAWFDFPSDLYIDLVAKTNRVDPEFARSALEWKVDPVKPELDRLRVIQESLGEAELALAPESETGYSSQDSRRKLKMGFAMVESDGEAEGGEAEIRRPKRLSELTERPVHLSSFEEPGKYRIEGRRRFDLRFLREVEEAEIFRVRPRTDYDFNQQLTGADRAGEEYLEIHLRLGGRTIVIGNLPLELLVPQSDFAIHGFGVGVLPSEGFAERRKFLIEQGPAPSFAYLCETRGEELVTLNSHEFGLEQVFIRTHLGEDRAWWEVTLTSYERIVDLVKFEVTIPEALREPLDEARMRYIAPLHQTYRDDNLR